MKKTIFLILMLIPIVSVHSQVSEGGSFLGGSIGLWTKGNTPVFGASFESEIGGTESGTFGIGGLFRYHGYNEVYNNGSPVSIIFHQLALREIITSQRSEQENLLFI